ncbi:type II secretion system F family protein [Gordonia sp. NPDC003424]
MSLVLLACAVGVLWWPATRAEHRLRSLQATSSRHRGVSGWPVAISIPIVTLVVSGIAPAVVAAVAVGLMVRRRRRRLTERALEAEAAALVSGLSVMIAELSVGAPPVRACSSAAAELRDSALENHSVAEYLASMAARAELGGQIGSGGDSGQARDRVARAWELADRHGLPLVDLLEAVRADLHARRRFADRTRASLAGPRATAAVLAGLPLLGIVLGQLMGAHPIAVLLGGGWGGMLLIVGTFLTATGLLWSDRIVDRAVAV